MSDEKRAKLIGGPWSGLVDDDFVLRIGSLNLWDSDPNACDGDIWLEIMNEDEREMWMSDSVRYRAIPEWMWQPPDADIGYIAPGIAIVAFRCALSKFALSLIEQPWDTLAYVAGRMIEAIRQVGIELDAPMWTVQDIGIPGLHALTLTVTVTVPVLTG